MRAIVLMFDSLNRRMLPCYGNTSTHAPNFSRLAERTAVFDTCYAGSMPCMPARREMHTGRYNFLHRSWSPIEPFDDSVPEMLRKAGIYTHLITDHQHYWEDGGATYHNRFSSYEFFRGQEGDLWKGDVTGIDRDQLGNFAYRMRQQDKVNRRHMASEADHPQTGVFDAGLEFITTNAGEDDWMVQIETFDPHEPFFSYDRWHRLYPDNGKDFDWPPYDRVTEDEATVTQGRNRYLALLSMCDANLGRLLDLMDERDMWKDTMLIVCTDHGYMLGEKGWWSKSVMPWYDETIHTPLFVWDPRAAVKGERRKSLVQTIDIGPTLLDLFGQAPTRDMEGQALSRTVRSDTPVREAGLFGMFGSHVSVTDGRYVYMRASATPENRPLFEHTLMPTHMRARFSPEELAEAELFPPSFSFTKGAPVLKMPAWTMGSPWSYGTLLFDLETDPEQETPLDDPALELRMIGLLVDLMRRNEAPAEQFERLGLPATGTPDETHLLVRAQWAQVQTGRRRALRESDFPDDARIATTTIGELMKTPARDLLSKRLPQPQNDMMAYLMSGKTIVQLAATHPELTRDRLEEIERDLAALSPS
ncbi:sulfatase [uncultured Martelella sp.]|uniref:sulfatase n=1 Tax=uncultured Martelella sp. TaxID=392331 RepID=UPI0029C75F43|nr:sulfatase [uncultured Martelella sp.]